MKETVRKVTPAPRFTGCFVYRLYLGDISEFLYISKSMYSRRYSFIFSSYFFIFFHIFYIVPQIFHQGNPQKFSKFWHISCIFSGVPRNLEITLSLPGFSQFSSRVPKKLRCWFSTLKLNTDRPFHKGLMDLYTSQRCWASSWTRFVSLSVFLCVLCITRGINYFPYICYMIY